MDQLEICQLPRAAIEKITAGPLSRPELIYMDEFGDRWWRKPDGTYSSSVSGDGGELESADITDATAAGRSMLTAATAAAQWALLRATARGEVEVATWADLPAAGSVTVGRTYTVLSTGWRVYSDGTCWRPANGRALIAQRSGSLPSPIATVTGVTSGDFTLPVIPTIPAGMLSAPHSRLLVNALIRRTTGTAIATVQVRIGTAGTAADPSMMALTMSAGANLDLRVDAFAHFSGATTSYSSTSWAPPNGTATGAQTNRSTNIDTAAAMSVSIGVTTANTADSFSLIYYGVWVEG